MEGSEILSEIRHLRRELAELHSMVARLLTKDESKTYTSPPLLSLPQTQFDIMSPVRNIHDDSFMLQAPGIKKTSKK
jgi:hypothetical protein